MTIVWLANIVGVATMMIVGMPLARALGRPWDDRGTLLEVWFFATATFLAVVYLPRQEGQ